MWIFSKDGCKIVNSGQVKQFEVTTFEGNILWADDIVLGEFETEKDAKEELTMLYNTLVGGCGSYQVG